MRFTKWGDSTAAICNNGGPCRRSLLDSPNLKEVVAKAGSIEGLCRFFIYPAALLLFGFSCVALLCGLEGLFSIFLTPPLGGISSPLHKWRGVICRANRREEKNRLLRPLRHAQRPWHYSLVTVPVMYPYGSSVAIKISLLFSMPNCCSLKSM